MPQFVLAELLGGLNKCPETRTATEAMLGTFAREESI